MTAIIAFSRLRQSTYDAIQNASNLPKNGAWRESVRDYLIRSGIDRSLIQLSYDGVDVFAPAPDKATGVLGHLGVCLGRIIP